MTSRMRNLGFLSLSILLLPALSLASGLQVNGTCQVGDCSTGGLQTSAVTYGTSTGPTNFNFDYYVGSDEYDISGTYSGSYLSGTYIFIDASVAYIGASPSATADTISLDYLLDYYDNSPGSWDGTYNENIPVIVPSGATFSGNVCYDTTQCVGSTGTLGPGTYNINSSAPLTGLDGDYLDADFNLTFNFQKGTATNTGIVVLASPVPEPAFTIPVACVLLALGCAALIRRRKLSQQEEQ